MVFRANGSRVYGFWVEGLGFRSSCVFGGRLRVLVGLCRGIEGSMRASSETLGVHEAGLPG